MGVHTHSAKTKTEKLIASIDRLCAVNERLEKAVRELATHTEPVDAVTSTKQEK